jgi:hypothetical protein
MIFIVRKFKFFSWLFPKSLKLLNARSQAHFGETREHIQIHSFDRSDRALDIGFSSNYCSLTSYEWKWDICSPVSQLLGYKYSYSNFQPSQVVYPWKIVSSYSRFPLIQTNLDCISYVISLLANLNARTQSSSTLQDDGSTPQSTLGSSPQQHTVGNGILSSLPVASLRSCTPANGNLTTNCTVQGNGSVIRVEKRTDEFLETHNLSEKNNVANHVWKLIHISSIH